MKMTLNYLKIDFWVEMTSKRCITLVPNFDLEIDLLTLEMTLHYPVKITEKKVLHLYLNEFAGNHIF